MATKDAWDVAVAIAQIVSAIGTMAAVGVTLWLTYASRKPKVRIELATHQHLFKAARASEGRLVVTNLGDRNVVLIDARWRVGRQGKSMSFVFDFYGDDEEKMPLTWSEIKPQFPRAYEVPYGYNTRNLRSIVDGPLTVKNLRRVKLEAEFSSGHVVRIPLPNSVADELEKFIG